MQSLNFVKEFLSISSVSGDEKEILLFIEEYLKNNNIDFKRIKVSDDRWNILAKRNVDNKESLGIIFSGHCDTVPSEKHYKPYEKDKKLYAIGSTDMKGALGVMIYQFVTLKTDKKIGLLVTVGEETTLDGAKELLNHKDLFKDFSYALIAEPTELKLFPMQYGIASVNVKITGKQRHTANFNDDSHCVHDFISISDKIIKDFKEKFPESILSINIVNSGFKENIIPPEINVFFDIRTDPKTKVEDINLFLRKYLDKYNITFTSKHSLESIDIDKGNKLIDFIKYNIEDKNYYTIKGFTEMYFTNMLGLESVIFGPGNMSLAHCVGEYVELELLEKFEEMIQKIIINGIEK
jgi:acetylornithine deacetylase/succinyl-diaminopimelate desuccinylase-like protein